MSCFNSRPCVAVFVLQWSLWLVAVCGLAHAEPEVGGAFRINSEISPRPAIQARAATLPPSLFGISGGGSAELGQQIILSVSFSGPGTDQIYQWRKGSTDLVGATDVSYAINAATAADSGTYSVTVTNSAGSSVASTEVTVKALTAPIITVSPPNRAVTVGQSTTFSPSVTGSYPRTYQWQKNGSAIAGATAANYTILAVTTADAGTYTVTVSNSQGSSTSFAASLTVNAATPPVISSPYPFDVTATQGQQASLSVSLGGGSSPFTYQWLKAGVAIPGATGGQLVFAAISPTDAGKYSVVVTNVAGTATSREATLTVNPAVPIAISQQPQSQTVVQGGSANFFISINSGTSPITYQWFKNGAAISGATSGNFLIGTVTFSDAGNYTVTATNILGSVTSSASVLTVSAAVLPSITTQPASQSVVFSGSISLGVQVNGSSPFTYVWKKDGVAISGATSSSYFVSSATPAQSGIYTVTVSNVAGSVTSNPSTVTVATAVAPTITTQPADKQVAVGLFVSFSVNYTSTGTGQLSFQWLKNGAPLSGATSSGYSINAVKDTDSGSYRLVITGAGGTVTSTAAILTVLPPAPPSVQFWPTSANVVSLGASSSFSISGISGTAPFTYQWTKNGVPIPGATNSTLSFSSVTPADLATYTLTISNEGGVTTSPGMRLRLASPSPFGNSASSDPWLDVGRVGDVVYFLATLPARIERYDLAAERWLPTTLLSETQVPTAFVPAPEGVYIAYGRVLVRRPLDLTTETPLTNTATGITQMFVFENYLYYDVSSSGSSSGYATLHRTTLNPGPAATLGRFSGSGYRQIALAPSLRKGFARSTAYSPADIEAFTIAADGSAPSSIDSPYHGTMPVGSRCYVFPGDQLVTDDSGTVYRTSDLTYAGAFGEPFTDLTFLGDGTPVVLRGLQLIATRADNFIETSRASLTQAGLRAFAKDSTVFVFGAVTSGTTFAVNKVTAANFAPAAAPEAGALPAGRYSVDDAFIGDNNIVHVFSRTLQGFVRWNPATRAYLTTVPLRSAPTLVFHQPGNRRALIAYPDGVITEVPLSAGVVSERTLANIGHNVRALTDLGDFFTVNISDAQSSGDDRLIFGPGTGPRFISTSLYNGPGLAWQPTARRLYSVPAFAGSVQYEVITTAGTLAAGTGNSGSTSLPATPPIRFNSEGTLVATANGRVFNADLAQVGVLANDVLDSAWLGSGLFSIRNRNGQTEVQQWSRLTYLQAGSVTVRGIPVRLLRLSDAELLVVSSLQGFLTFTLVGSDLSVSAPPDVRTFAGIYFAKLGANGSSGDLALYLRADGTGVLLAYLSGTRTALLSTNVALNSDGTFVASARDLVTGSLRTLAGALQSDGTVSGSIPTVNLTFAGARSSGGGTPGYYQAPAVNGGFGNAYAIVGPDGRGLLVVQNASILDGGMAAVDAASSLVVTTSSGVRLTASINVGTGSLIAAASGGALAGTTFAGLREGVDRTDRLANIATRGRAGTGDDTLIAGFVISGSAPRQVLIRAVGPPLANFGIAGAIADPKLTLFRGGSQLAQSDNWSSEVAASSIAAATTKVGAFALPSPGQDAVLLSTLDPGAYTAQVGAATGAGGVSLVEVYDAGDGVEPGMPKLINISTRATVGAGEDLLIAGIVVKGNVPKRVLIRAVGPTLTTLGVGGALADPVLTILSGATAISSNDDWGLTGGGITSSDIASVAASVGAFPLSPGSKDACVLITLQSGNYTAQVSGKGTATGVALVEVYEIPN